MATAHELFEARHYPSVVTVVSDALVADPENVPLLLMRARARIALHRDLEAQADLRDIIRLDPRCAGAYRLLGTLAARRDEDDSAAIFFREALRLDPLDREAADWLAIVAKTVRPDKRPPRPKRAPTPLPVPRFARGTVTPAEASPVARGSEPKEAPLWKTPGPEMLPHAPRTITRGPVPELPGFGEYLVASGVLTRERLRAAQAYQRSMRVQLSTAIVTLGLASPQRIEWAAVSHQTQLARSK
jgi:tetratricopeptide (TPR) repeat protein